MTRCKNCGADGPQPPDAPYFEVQTLRKRPPCPQCENVPIQREWSDFCSLKCLLEYAATTEFKAEVAKVTA